MHGAREVVTIENVLQACGRISSYRISLGHADPGVHVEAVDSSHSRPMKAKMPISAAYQIRLSRLVTSGRRLPPPSDRPSQCRKAYGTDFRLPSGTVFAPCLRSTCWRSWALTSGAPSGRQLIWQVLEHGIIAEAFEWSPGPGPHSCSVGTFRTPLQSSRRSR